jgi:hypothetical protein
MTSELVKKDIVILHMDGLKLQRIAMTTIFVPMITVILRLRVMYASMNQFVAMIATLVPLTNASLRLVVLIMLMLNVKQLTNATFPHVRKE